MKHRQLTSRRFIFGIISVACLTFLGYVHQMDVAGAIALIAVSIAGAGAIEGYSENSRKDKKNE